MRFGYFVCKIRRITIFVVHLATILILEDMCLSNSNYLKKHTTQMIAYMYNYC